MRSPNLVEPASGFGPSLGSENQRQQTRLQAAVAVSGVLFMLILPVVISRQPFARRAFRSTIPAKKARVL